jgi:hypothetical protein
MHGSRVSARALCSERRPSNIVIVDICRASLSQSQSQAHFIVANNRYSYHYLHLPSNNMAASTEHLRKRQYQPSINSYFQRNGSKTAELGSSSNQISPMTPSLPAETQSSLLTVGMRVRKSVPEGYKTHKTMPTEEFPFSSTAPANAAAARPAYTTTNSRELAPFCGLHKTGGLSSQGSFEGPPSSAPPAFPSGRDSNSSMPALSMSQSTLLSTQSSILSNAVSEPSNKRSYEEDIEDGLDAYFDEVEAEEQMVPVEGRRITRLKNSPRKQTIGDVRLCGSTDGVTGDFEEAPFLAPMETEL